MLGKRSGTSTTTHTDINSKWFKDRNELELELGEKKKLGKSVTFDLALVYWVRHQEHRQQPPK